MTKTHYCLLRLMQLVAVPYTGDMIVSHPIYIQTAPYTLIINSVVVSLQQCCNNVLFFVR